MTTSRPSDRRAQPRHAIRLSAEVTTPERTFAAVTRDLSAGGCCLEAAYALPEEAELELALFVVVDDIEEAGMPPLRCRATVQWHASNDEAAVEAQHLAGLRFAELSDAQLAWLARFFT
jgi:c-di-GMP-binding flagellar brake protein YcgR